MNRGTVALLVALLVAPLVSGCSPMTSVGSQSPPAATGSPPSALSPEDPYRDLARRLHSRGVEVWFEADLVRSWLDGPAAFRATLQRLATLARVPGVAGFKIADELGYDDGLTSPRQVRRFLRAADAALDAVAPGAEILVDLLVPALGCVPWLGAPQRSCAGQAEREYPATTTTAVTGYLRTGSIDRLDLSTGLLEPQTYEGWGLTRQEAQRQAWRRVRVLGWSRHTVLQSRKALAAPGGYGGSTRDAEIDVATYVEEPVAGGAAAVDIWTWRQPYAGATVSLLDEQLRPNPLWLLLGELPPTVRLFTHMTPSALPTDAARVEVEIELVATVFDAVFVAAGTG